MSVCDCDGPLEKIVYLDNNATTRVAPEVVEVMVHYLTLEYGNSESIHHFGGDLQAVEQETKRQVANLINGRHDNVYFTSGATESNNWAIRGVMRRAERNGKKHLITSSVEHPSVKNVFEDMEKEGYQVTFLPVTSEGLVRVVDLVEAVREDTALVSIMYANNETGSIMPISEIGDFLHDKPIVFHCDATQAIGKIPVDVHADHIDLLSLSAHKFHGPKGIGVFYWTPRKKIPEQRLPWRVEVSPLIVGGEQQDYMRGGTMNTPSIAGLGKAAELAQDFVQQEDENHRVERLRDMLQRAIVSQIPDVIVNSVNARRVPNTLDVILPGAEGESIIDRLSVAGICASTGSACTSKSLAIPHVLDAMGVDHNIINSAIRFSLSRYTTEEEIRYVINKLPEVIDQLRRFSGYKRS